MNDNQPVTHRIKLGRDGLPKPVYDVSRIESEANRTAYFDAANRTAHKRKWERTVVLRVVQQRKITGKFCTNHEARCEWKNGTKCDWYGDDLVYGKTRNGNYRGRPDRVKDCRRERVPSRREEGLR